MIEKLKSQLTEGKLQRRHIRYKLFRLRDNTYEGDDGHILKEFIEKQFKSNHNWNGFTFDWDVGVIDPLKVITIDQWMANGGKFDELGRRSPPAFTNQE